ncbi:hypothetical protein E1B28_004656 [Marasmius oreades]|nr:uncharacterized protein E1B28_004656 [Marasmius oreades]KAG7097292.1 hypothetical protein E1B28_004656 [Marasmius oreades]
MGKVVSGNPIITILSNSRSHISLAEPNFAKAGATKQVANYLKPADINAQPIMPTSIRALAVSSETQADVGTGTSSNIKKLSSPISHTTRSLSKRKSKPGHLEFVSSSDAPPKGPVAGSHPPPRSHPRSRRRRRRQAGKTPASDVDGRSTEGSVNKNRSSLLQETRASITSSPPSPTHGLSSRWAPHFERSIPTVASVASDSTHEGKPEVPTGDKTDKYRRSVPPGKDALATCESQVPTVEMSGTSLQSPILRQDNDRRGENPSLVLPTQPVVQVNQHLPEASTNYGSPPALNASHDPQVTVLDSTMPATGLHNVRQAEPISLISQLPLQQTNNFGGRVGSISTIHRPLAHGLIPSDPLTGFHNGSSVAVDKPFISDSQFSSHHAREPCHFVPRRPHPSVQYPLDPLYWKVHDTCGDVPQSRVKRLDSGTDVGALYEHSIPRRTKIADPRLMHATSQHLGDGRVVPFRPQPSQPNPNLMDAPWIVPTQQNPKRMESSLTQAPPSRSHVKQIRPVVSMPMINLQYQQPVPSKHSDQDASHAGFYCEQNDIIRPMAAQRGIDLRLPIHTTSEASFHNNPPPAQVMNISQGIASHPSPAAIGCPKIPDKDFNSKRHDFRIRSYQRSVVVGVPKEEPVNAQKLDLQRQGLLLMDIRVSGVQRGLQPVREREDGQKEVPADIQSLTSQRQLNSRADSHSPATEDVPQYNASERKRLQTSVLDRPSVRTKPEEILAWRTDRNESTSHALIAKRSMPTLKYVPPSVALSKGTSVNAKDNKSFMLSSKTVVSRKRRVTTALGDGQPRMITPPPLKCSTARSFDSDEKVPNKAKRNGNTDGAPDSGCPRTSTPKAGKSTLSLSTKSNSTQALNKTRSASRSKT